MLATPAAMSLAKENMHFNDNPIQKKAQTVESRAGLDLEQGLEQSLGLPTCLVGLKVEITMISGQSPASLRCS